MPQHERIDYLELPARDLPATKAFFTDVFGWAFTDYGPTYAAFDGAGIDGGFYASDDLVAETARGSALVVFYSDHLEATLQRVEAAGGLLLKPIFDFPGGRRFHFADPSGNEWAVWGAPADDA